MEEIDYAITGLDISQAKVDQAKRHPDKSTRPDYIIWGGNRVQTYDWWDVPKSGTIEVEFISALNSIEQGVDIKIDQGGIWLASGEEISVLRTWKDDHYEEIVRYLFHSLSGRLCIWNVYKVRHPNGHAEEEKWTGNAGFLVEHRGEHERIYRCSPGDASPPNFEALVFRVSVSGKPAP